VRNTYDFDLHGKRGPDDSPQRGVHTRGIATAGENPNLFQCRANF
jgi:hypothetical protein